LNKKIMCKKGIKVYVKHKASRAEDQ